MKIAVLGSGAWGTALAIGLCPRHDLTLWIRDRGHYEEMIETRVNRRHLDPFPIPESVVLSNDFDAATREADLVLIAVPMSGLRKTFRSLAGSGRKIPVIWVSKGFESGTSKLPHQVAMEEYDAIAPYGVLSGPSFAREVAEGLPVALTLASNDRDFAARTASVLHNNRIRIYSSEDLIGVEVGGAVKNVMAIAAGISDGLGLGSNARAALVTRGLAEITRLGLKLGGKLETFLGLSGVGDLTLTCTGDLSRNRKVGLMLATGKPLEKILEELGATAEGVFTAKEVDMLARSLDVDMPITKAVCSVLYEGVPAIAAVEELMKRDPKAESDLGLPLH
ncbi:MAG TPA: NAD(P)H-dependent glycerol-3-phosphate dehydrogenase [Burkholderiales bacterium]|nr:NAD(P)H-dependent glycerol-3-phosphate dehydrogenase [Burkholderiales bacterium]